jgi:hypothetical protein
MMIVNNNSYKFTLPTGTDKYINLPIEIKWDFYGRDDSIDVYEEEVLEKIIGIAEDFEVTRFAHDNYDGDNTDVNYSFNFYSGLKEDLDTSDVSEWMSSYLAEGFGANEVYYYDKAFTHSFFKLDFYDTDEERTQINYFTVILPVQQGYTELASISPHKPDVNIKIPTFKLDYIGDKEGFFLYWLRKRAFISINTFYMSAKFFDAKLGIFVKMMNTSQSELFSTTNFESKDYFYYKIKLDYNTKTYQVLDSVTDERVGTHSPIMWYEYVNP